MYDSLLSYNCIFSIIFKISVNNCCLVSVPIVSRVFAARKSELVKYTNFLLISSYIRFVVKRRKFVDQYFLFVVPVHSKGLK